MSLHAARPPIAKAVLSVAEEPVFDSTRAALRFALNLHLAMPRPQINKMMERGKVQYIELADGSKIACAMPQKRKSSRRPSLGGLDGAATGGMVLRELSTLPEAQQLVLMGGNLVAILPCACRAPCCSGYRLNPDWSRVIVKLCDYLRDEAELSRVPGKKGMSIAPVLRRALVEKYYLPERKLVLADLAKACRLSVQTVYNHQASILPLLQSLEDAGWSALDRLLSEVGLVGYLG